MTDEYLKEVKPTFDMLFQMVNIVLEQGDGQDAKNALTIMKSQKAFDLLWKSYTAS